MSEMQFCSTFYMLQICDSQKQEPDVGGPLWGSSSVGVSTAVWACPTLQQQCGHVHVDGTQHQAAAAAHLPHVLASNNEHHISTGTPIPERRLNVEIGSLERDDGFHDNRHYDSLMKEGGLRGDKLPPQNEAFFEPSLCPRHGVVFGVFQLVVSEVERQADHARRASTNNSKKQKRVRFTSGAG